ncbi:hypothetical protein AK812_SmicGene236 [Symbiodinium microadriaticum]|uniref:5-hmdU DNA kinase helical domain-containing protein n=1 Tax=Symbiodinium microadriaticum TaxID=2951 RepID=A0A1Q9F746_SYMMI|nr:hypothetical protein AK812_SmicGene236 [Symbiodinium microadriaticum]
MFATEQTCGMLTTALCIPLGLCLHLPQVADLYNFMKRRETARVRREVKRLPPHQWYESGDIMRFIFLTNVRREDDVTTRAVRTALSPALEAFRLHGGDGSWSTEQQRVAALIVFHCALFRAFGTKDFIANFGFMLDLDAWDSRIFDAALCAARRCWQSQRAVFTEAYCPSRALRRLETAARRGPRVSAEVFLERLVRRTCKQLRGLWDHRFQIALEAERTRSWRAVIESIMRVPHFGGTGFVAKELTSDLLQTCLFCTWSEASQTWESQCEDLNGWCPVGPGARRGLNRLHGRPTNAQAYSHSQAISDKFIQELLAIYAQRTAHWNPSDLIEDLSPAGELMLHDVQFQLCEFDKYERARLEQGRVRRYDIPEILRTPLTTLYLKAKGIADGMGKIVEGNKALAEQLRLGRGTPGLLLM